MKTTYTLGQSYRPCELLGIEKRSRHDDLAEYRYVNAVNEYLLTFLYQKEGNWQLVRIANRNERRIQSSLEVLMDDPDQRARRGGL